MRTALFAAAAAAGLAAATPGFAATVTFEDLPSSGNPFLVTENSGGMTFTSAHAHVLDPADTRLANNGTNSIGAEAASNLGRPLDFGLTGGGAFTLNSVDVAEFWQASSGLSDFMDVIFTGNQSGGGVLSLTFTLDGIRDGVGGANDFQTVAFAGWTDLLSVTVTGRNVQGAFGDYQLDNIVYDSTQTAVPEPATWALLILGFGAVGGALRRRRRPSLLYA